jgi:hypothetical protein
MLIAYVVAINHYMECKHSSTQQACRVVQVHDLALALACDRTNIPPFFLYLPTIFLTKTF